MANLRTTLAYLRHWAGLRWRKWIVHPLCSHLYRDWAYDSARAILVAGTGRSGTTWLADLLTSERPSRVMFEPFHNRYVAAFRPFHYFHYMRPTDHDEQLLAFCRSLVRGEIRHPWIDREMGHLFPKQRVIKAIRANLFLRWFHDTFSEVPIIFVIRHPCAVVLSRMDLGWATDADISPFLAQPKLIEDFLEDKMDVIRDARTPAEKHAVIWCIHNLVPLRQFAPGTLNIFFYETLCEQPGTEIRRLFKITDQRVKDTTVTQSNRPSQTTTKHSAVMHGNDRVRSWQQRLSPDDTNAVRRVVARFGLEWLYGDGLLPQEESSIRSERARTYYQAGG